MIGLSQQTKLLSLGAEAVQCGLKSGRVIVTGESTAAQRPAEQYQSQRPVKDLLVHRHKSLEVFLRHPLQAHKGCDQRMSALLKLLSATLFIASVS